MLTCVMHTDHPSFVTPEQRHALTSPLRMEIVGLFAYDPRLSIADMARRMSVSPSSLYHHIRILEDVGLLRQAGLRRSGKRDAALFELEQHTIEVPLESEGEDPCEDARRTVATAFRMAERDFADALERRDFVTEGESRNLIATRAHVLASPQLLAKINKHIDDIFDLLAREGTRAAESGEGPTEGQHMSLTFALLPLRGRRFR